MRPIPPALQAKLESGATTLCRCWIITRRDGVALGFTDHDRDLVIDGVACLAASGLNVSEATKTFGLSVGGSEISGAIVSPALSEDDLAAGMFDGAEVKAYLVDWSEPALNLLLSAGVLGEIRRADKAFTAEVRGPAYRLAEESGRFYAPKCSAELGDQRCKINLSLAQWRGNGAVTAAEPNAVIGVSGLSSFAAEFFTAGKLLWTAGANVGASLEVKSHRREGSNVRLTLWQPAAHPIAIGDAFVVTAGCGKDFATCRDRFANTANFRGFPHIPGNDYLVRHPVRGAAQNDGRSRTAPV